MTDTKKLRDKLEMSGYKLRFVASKMGISYQAFLKKINNETEFKASEIHILSILLSLSEEEKQSIFFCA